MTYVRGCYLEGTATDLITTNAITNATVTLQVFKITDEVLGTSEEQTVTAAGNSNTDNVFRFDPTSGRYLYNLDAGYSKGGYFARVVVNDGTSPEVIFSVK